LLKRRRNQFGCTHRGGKFEGNVIGKQAKSLNEVVRLLLKGLTSITDTRAESLSTLVVFTSPNPANRSLARTRIRNHNTVLKLHCEKTMENREVNGLFHERTYQVTSVRQFHCEIGAATAAPHSASSAITNTLSQVSHMRASECLVSLLGLKVPYCSQGKQRHHHRSMQTSSSLSSRSCSNTTEHSES